MCCVGNEECQQKYERDATHRGGHTFTVTLRNIAWPDLIRDTKVVKGILIYLPSYLYLCIVPLLLVVSYVDHKVRI